MADIGDPRDFLTWPDELVERAAEVVGSLADGDVKPLSGWLREGLPLHPVMALQLANMLDGDVREPYRLSTELRKRGQKGFSKSVIAHGAKMKVGSFVAHRYRELGRGCYDAAVDDGITKFRESKRTVKGKYRYFVDYLASVETDLLASGIDDPMGWLFALFSERSETA